MNAQTVKDAKQTQVKTYMKLRQGLEAGPLQTLKTYEQSVDGATIGLRPIPKKPWKPVGSKTVGIKND
jgi:hypothetical protein